jgi:peptidoglycan/xylan/chitin deacetylase (PgdA/CDA1 family)
VALKIKSSRLKTMALFFLRMSAVPYFVREVVQRRRVTILVYHKLPPETAKRHFAALRRMYNIISLADYLAYRDDASKHLPPKPLIVTFDDGHQGNYALKPILEKHGIRVTLFLCSGLVGTNRHFWFETEMSESVRQGLKHVSDEERLEVLATLGFSETAEQSTRQALSASEIEDMKPVVDFQSHTVYHPLLPQCSEPRAFDEISRSKIQLENNFGLSIYALAYPNGDYSSREIAAARQSGYQCALSLDHGFNSRETPPFQLKRICINDDASLTELVVKASGVWGLLKHLARGGSAHQPLRTRGAELDYRSPQCRSASQ